MEEYQVCSECGEKNDFGWSFCKNCSASLHKDNGKNMSQESSNVEVKRKKIKRIVIGVLAAVVVIVSGVIVYNRMEKNYQDRVFEAHLNYFGGDYEKAKELIKGLRPKREDKELFEKIDLLNYIQLHESLFNMYLKPSPSLGIEANHAKALQYLLDGLRMSIEEGNRTQDSDLKMRLTVLKKKFLEYLETYYKLSEEESIELLDVSWTEEKHRLELIASRASRALEEEEQLEREKEEIRRNPLTIVDVSNETRNGYIIVTGAVLNRGDKPYRFIKVKVVYKDVNGNVVNTDWTYVDSEYLQPGEQKYFEIYSPDHKDITQYSVQIIDYSE